MTTANAQAIMENSVPVSAEFLPHTGVTNDRAPVDRLGYPAGQPVWGGPPDGPWPEDRPVTNALAWGAVHPDPASWDDNRPLPGWHGIVMDGPGQPHVGIMLPDYTPRTMARNAPVIPWDAGTGMGEGPVTF